MAVVSLGLLATEKEKEKDFSGNGTLDFPEFVSQNNETNKYSGTVEFEEFMAQNDETTKDCGTVDFAEFLAQNNVKDNTAYDFPEFLDCNF